MQDMHGPEKSQQYYYCYDIPMDGARMEQPPPRQQQPAYQPEDSRPDFPAGDGSELPREGHAASGQPAPMPLSPSPGLSPQPMGGPSPCASPQQTPPPQAQPRVSPMAGPEPLQPMVPEMSEMSVQDMPSQESSWMCGGPQMQAYFVPSRPPAPRPAPARKAFKIIDPRTQEVVTGIDFAPPRSAENAEPKAPVQQAASDAQAQAQLPDPGQAAAALPAGDPEQPPAAGQQTTPQLQMQGAQHQTQMPEQLPPLEGTHPQMQIATEGQQMQAQMSSKMQPESGPEDCMWHTMNGTSQEVPMVPVWDWNQLAVPTPMQPTKARRMMIQNKRITKPGEEAAEGSSSGGPGRSGRQPLSELPALDLKNFTKEEAHRFKSLNLETSSAVPGHRSRFAVVAHSDLGRKATPRQKCSSEDQGKLFSSPTREKLDARSCDTTFQAAHDGSGCESTPTTEAPSPASITDTLTDDVVATGSTLRACAAEWDPTACYWGSLHFGDAVASTAPPIEMVEIPHTGEEAFEVNDLLKWRHAADENPYHEGICYYADFRTAWDHPWDSWKSWGGSHWGSGKKKGGKGDKGDKGDKDRLSRPIFDEREEEWRVAKRKVKESLKPTVLARATTRDQDLERSVMMLLNKICPENLKTIVKQLSSLDIREAPDMEVMIRTMFQKALMEPHYSETYADAVYDLCACFPEFPPIQEGEKPQSFRRVMLNVVQIEFEHLPDAMSLSEEQRQSMSPEEIADELRKRKSMLLANMKFIGNLFLRRLLSMKVVGFVVHDLIGVKEDSEGPIEAHVLECACELLEAIGHTLDTTDDGRLLMSQFLARLQNLQPGYSKRVQFQVQDLFDLRSNNWVQKKFREQAKTMSEVRRLAKDGKQFELNAVGVRPAYAAKAPPPSDRMLPTTSTEQQPVWGQALVKKVFNYFVEDRDQPALVRDWRRGSPTRADAVRGLVWALELSADSARKAEPGVEGVLTLYASNAISFEVLTDGFSNFMERLEDFKLDSPNADSIVEHFVAAALSPSEALAGLLGTTGHLDGAESLLRVVASAGGDAPRRLLRGALRLVHQRHGAEAVRSLLGAFEIKLALCKLEGCKVYELEDVLSDAGLLA